MDIAKRNPQNPIMRPSDLKPGIEGMEIVCLLNPGVFRYNNKIWLLLRVAERPKQIENKISFPIYNKDGKIEILSFDKNDPSLDASDPRVIGYQGKNYLTTLSFRTWRPGSIRNRRLSCRYHGRWLLLDFYRSFFCCCRSRVDRNKRF